MRAVLSEARWRNDAPGKQYIIATQPNDNSSKITPHLPITHHFPNTKSNQLRKVIGRYESQFHNI